MTTLNENEMLMAKILSEQIKQLKLAECYADAHTAGDTETVRKIQEIAIAEWSRKCQGIAVACRTNPAARKAIVDLVWEAMP